jgi:hypothetical protein
MVLILTRKENSMLQEQIDTALCEHLSEYLRLRGEPLPEEEQGLQVMLSSFRLQLTDILSNDSLVREIQLRNLVVPEYNARGGA